VRQFFVLSTMLPGSTIRVKLVVAGMGPAIRMDSRFTAGVVYESDPLCLYFCSCLISEFKLSLADCRSGCNWRAPR